MTDTSHTRSEAAVAGEGASWPGLEWLAEEIGELSTVISKISDGNGGPAILREELMARMGTVRAAIEFTVSHNSLNWEVVNQRRDRQRSLYEAEHARARQAPPGGAPAAR